MVSKAGWHHDAYVFVYPTYDVHDWFRRGALVAGEYGVMRVAVDVEGDYLMGLPAEQRHAIYIQKTWDGINAVQEAGMEAIIYTSYYYYDRLVGLGYTGFADAGIKLWKARYDWRPNFDGDQPLGGWTLETTVGKQYAGSADLCGVTVDYNVWRG